VLLQAKNADGAIPHLKKFHDARPDDPRGVFALGVAYFDAEQLDQAQKEFESVVNQPETRVGANLYLGRLAMRDDKLDEAADHLQRAIQASPSAPEPYAELGLVEIRRHEYGLAEKALSQAVQLSPDSYRANLNLLMLYQRTKDARADGQAQRVEQLVKAGEERERLLLRSLEIHPY
jgi:Flp pilus assembly protein TadD